MDTLDPAGAITTAITSFSGDAATVIPVALGVAFAIWGVKKLAGLAKGLVR